MAQVKYVELKEGQERDVSCGEGRITFVGGPGESTKERVYVVSEVEKKCGSGDNSVTYIAYLSFEARARLLDEGDPVATKVAARTTDVGLPSGN